MNKTAKSSQKPNHNQSPNHAANTLPNSNNKKQFPSVSLTRHLQDYKAYRSIDNRKKFPDIDKNTTFNISPQQRSILMMRNAQIPSIHNAYDISAFQMPCGKIQKMQLKILKQLIHTKKEQQWRLYISKSELMTKQKSHQFQEIEEYLLKTIYRIMDKTWNNKDNDKDEQNSHLGFNNVECGGLTQKQMTKNNFNKTFSNSIIDSSALNNKNSQPSLRVLKDQINTLALSPNDMSSILSNNLNKTSINFNNNNANTSSKINQQMLIQNLQQQLNKQNFQKSILQKKLQLYQSHISKLQSRLRQQNIPIDPNQQSYDEYHRSNDDNQILNSTQQGSKNVKKPNAKKHHSNSEQIMLKNLVNQNKYKSEAEFKKIQNQTLIRELNIIKEFSFKLKGDNMELATKIEKLEKQCQQCREYKKYKQLWLMQCQQMIGWKDLWKEKKQQTLKLNNKIKILKQKNKQLLHSFNFSMVVNPDQEQDKQQLQTIIRGFQQWLKVISVPRVNCSAIDPKSLIDSECVKQSQYLPDPDNLNYKLLKPNFFIFFQAYQKTIMMQKNILNTRPLQQTFFVKIRAILDSMYNHFNSYNHFKDWASFPQFVIGFLQKYQVNFTTLKIQQRKKPMSSQEKLTFLMNLFNKKLSNTWECEMFRSFILEEYTLDQIYFFLDCRNDLNGGATLIHGLGVMDPVSYVKLHKALSTTQRKLVPYQNHIIQRVKTIIKSRKKQKNGQQFIDRHFVLKLLLQVYALQKVKSQRVFQASFKTKSHKKQLISYSDFFNFMAKNFQFLTTIEICQLYRQTYSLSSGKITHKTVHYICSSKGLFIPLIWTKRLNMNVLDKSFNNDMMLLDIQNNTRKIGLHLHDLGVESVSRIQNDVNYFLRQLDWYRNNRQVFYFKLQQIKLKIIKSNCLLGWQSSTYTPNQMLSSQQIRQGIMQIHTLVHQSTHSTHLLSKKKQQKQKAYKLLTRNFKIRIQQSMAQFKRVDQDQLNKLKQQVAMEIKMRQMRLKNQQIEKKNQQKLNNHKDKPLIGNSFINVTNVATSGRKNTSTIGSAFGKSQQDRRGSVLEKLQANINNA